MIRCHITFTGHVQGMGFRCRACRAASLYGCTGWVRNGWDGSVTMGIQGKEDNIGRVIHMIRAARCVEIEKKNSRQIPLEDERAFRTEC